MYHWCWRWLEGWYEYDTVREKNTSFILSFVQLWAIISWRPQKFSPQTNDMCPRAHKIVLLFYYDYLSCASSVCIFWLWYINIDSCMCVCIHLAMTITMTIGAACALPHCLQYDFVIVGFSACPIRYCSTHITEFYIFIIYIHIYLYVCICYIDTHMNERVIFAMLVPLVRYAFYRAPIRTISNNRVK